MSKSNFKIISGGQTGADRAALDAAISLGVEYGGSVPPGRKAEDGIVPLEYTQLKELSIGSYSARTERNIVDSDATLIFTEGKPTGGTALTVKLAKKQEKPFLVIDFKNKNTTELVNGAIAWLSKIKPSILNIAGPRESKTPGIYQKSNTFIRLVLTAYLE